MHTSSCSCIGGERKSPSAVKSSLLSCTVVTLSCWRVLLLYRCRVGGFNTDNKEGV
jgi:hypothetical protein